MSKLTKGGQIGSALNRLARIDDWELTELAALPQSVHNKAQAKRDAVLGELEPDVKAAVVAARSAQKGAAK